MIVVPYLACLIITFDAHYDRPIKVTEVRFGGFLTNDDTWSIFEKELMQFDLCHLGRHNGVYEEPRKVLESIPGLELVEMERNRELSLCCGGGGGRFWTETAADERFSNMRLDEASETGAKTLVTGCPFCILNFEDSTKGSEKDVEILDVVEML